MGETTKSGPTHQHPHPIATRRSFTPEMLLYLENADMKNKHREGTLSVLSMLRSRSESMSEVIKPSADDAMHKRKTANMIGNLLLDALTSQAQHRMVIEEFATALVENYSDVLQIMLPYGPDTDIPMAHYASFYRNAAEAIFREHPEMFDLTIKSNISNPERYASDSLIVWLVEHESVLEMIIKGNPILLYKPVYGKTCHDLVALAEALIDGKLERLASRIDGKGVQNITESISRIIGLDDSFLSIIYERLAKVNEDSAIFERIYKRHGLSKVDRQNMKDLARRSRKLESNITEVLRKLSRE